MPGSDYPICVNPDYWSDGHIEDLDFDDDDILLGNDAVISSIVGTAQAGNWGDEEASDDRMQYYDLLFFSARISRREHVAFDSRYDRAMFGYRVTAAAVGWDTSAAMPSATVVDDGTPGELLLPDRSIALPWGAYYCLLSTRCIDPPSAGQFCNTVSNNDVWSAVLPNNPSGIVDGVKFAFSLYPRERIDGMDPSGLSARRILNSHVVAFRINRKDYAT